MAGRGNQENIESNLAPTHANHGVIAIKIRAKADAQSRRQKQAYSDCARVARIVYAPRSVLRLAQREVKAGAGARHGLGPD